MAPAAENAIGADDQFIHRQHVHGDQETKYEKDVRKLVDLLSNLNPSAREFFPSSYPAAGRKLDGRLSAFIRSTDFDDRHNGYRSSDSNCGRSSSYQQLNRRRNGDYSQGRWMKNRRVRRDEMEEGIRRTVYVSDIDPNVTEVHLAELFATCGQVVDCRVCGDHHSTLRFAFIEFAEKESARAALNLGGTMLGLYPVKILPSKTAILPVNPKFLPQSNDEREIVLRTVYCTNIDKKVTQSEVKRFFEQACCGEVSHLRLLGDNVHLTRIAFVEFFQAESAILALNCSGMLLGSLPIRISPSKTPVRPRFPRAGSNSV
ncbi:Polyadenylate-binding protein 2 [Platanthera zijinensis]|uniref:Polyadenylate-binding protein 2 n=1 Tax=Platanthera zijinensis TaxID=2320716 RepID=A0AAP0BCC0_9ASPA